MGNLDDALNFIEKKKILGHNTEYRVGIVLEDIGENHKRGDVVVYSADVPFGEECEDKPTLVIETPHSPEEIEKRLNDGNGILSRYTKINVPLDHIEKIEEF